MTKKVWIAIAVAIGVAVTVGIMSLLERAPEITTFAECVAAGNPVAESYPEQCFTKDGRRFLRDVQEGIYCTADAMQCPDGTWVGRTGPECEFVCP